MQILMLLLLSSITLAAETAKVLHVEGGVHSAGKPLAAGATLSAGSVVSTDSDSTAVLSLDEDRVKVVADSELVLTRPTKQNTSLELRRGGVFAKIKASAAKRRFEIRTGTAVMGVRGTEFFTSYGKGEGSTPDVWMCVNDGEVEVTRAGQSTRVPKGQGVFVSAKKGITPPKPYAWTRGLNWNMDPAAGGVRDSTKMDSAYGDLLDHDYD